MLRARLGPLLALALSAVAVRSLPAQVFGLGEGVPPAAGSASPVVVAAPGPEPFVVTFAQGSGAPFHDLIPQIEAKAKFLGHTVNEGTFLLVADVSHQLVQITASGVNAPTWEAETEALRKQVAAGDTRAEVTLARQQELLKSWEGRFISYEHHGPVASLQAKAQGIPNAASMIMRDWEVLARTLRERYTTKPGNIGIVIHEFSDADAITSKMLMEELSKRITGQVGLEVPVDPMLEHMATVRARQADQGNLGTAGTRIERTIEGALEGVNYDIEARAYQEGKAVKAPEMQVQAATEFVEVFMEKARERLVAAGTPRDQIASIPVEQRIPDAAIPELVQATQAELARRPPTRGRLDLRSYHEGGAQRIEKYRAEVEALMREASRRPGEVVTNVGNEYVRSASVQDVWVETSEGGMKKVRMLTVEITQPPISKAAFWTAYNSTGGGAHPPAEVVLIKGTGPVNWFAGSQRGISLKGITAPLADAAPRTIEGRKGPVFEPTGTSRPWKQNFPAFKGAAYDWAISLGSIDFEASGGTIHDLSRDLAREGQRLATEGGHTGSRLRASSALTNPISAQPQAPEIAALREVAQKLQERAVRETDPTRAQELLDQSRRLRENPGAYSIEAVLQMPGVRELPLEERTALRRHHEERLRRLREAPGSISGVPEEGVRRPRVRVPRIIP